MNLVALTLREARYDWRAFWRNPASAFFTIVFPLMFLVIFNLVLGNQSITTAQGEVNTATFYVPAIVSMGVISACYTNIAISTAFARERGILKRVRGTPLPALAFLVGRIMQAIAVAILLVIVVLAMGVVFYGVDLPDQTLPAFVITLLIGAACFCSLGLAITSIIPNADASPAVVNASILPLLFISDVFIPTSQAPEWLNSFASIFPVVHFASAMHTAFSPFETGSGLELKDLAILLAWAAAGVLVAARFFTWEPKK